LYKPVTWSALTPTL